MNMTSKFQQSACKGDHEIKRLAWVYTETDLMLLYYWEFNSFFWWGVIISKQPVLYANHCVI